jgi:hypothetical protein
MKEFWNILLEKLKQVDPLIASIEMGILGLFTIGMSTVVVCSLFNLIEDIVLAFSGKPLG